jgi:uncharacterized protein (DUF433 family)
MKWLREWRLSGTIGLIKQQETDTGHTPGTRGHIVIAPGYCGGKPHVAGRRIKVQHVAAWHELAGLSPDEIAAAYPGLSLADVHAALAYYYDHRDEIDADIRDDEAFVAKLRGSSPPSLLLRRQS